MTVGDAVATYRDRRFGREAYRILPGQYIAVPSSALIVTTLGSCVAACVRERASGRGGMNHFLLSEDGDPAGGPASEAARYGGHAMELLINALLGLGARRERLEVKVFGGASLFGSGGYDVGRRNGAFVLAYCAREGLPVVAQDLYGTAPRRVHFTTGTGEVQVRYLRSGDAIRASESEVARRLQAQRAHRLGGGAELFDP